jgi:secondary thiamine-phosphate synthase enzyme
MRHLFENHDLVTERCGQLIDVTDDVVSAVERSEVVNGMALVYTPHTTCAVLINELETGFTEDFEALLETLAPIEGSYRHDEHDLSRVPTADEPAEPPNGHAHCRAALLASSSQAIPVVGGSLLLGRYQRVFFCELDRSRPRKVFIQVLGQ